MNDSAHRPLASLPAIIAGLFLLAAVVLLPDLTPSEAIPVVGQRNDHGRIAQALGPDAIGLPLFKVELLDGDAAGTTLEAAAQDASAAMPGSADRKPYRVGDEVVVTSFTGPAGGFSVISEPWRLPLLGIVAALFAATVISPVHPRGRRRSSATVT